MNVKLRELKKGDAPELARLANNKKIWNHVRDAFPHPYTQKDAEQFLKYVMHESPPTAYAIEADGVFTGVTGCIPGDDVYSKTAEVGFWVGEPFWGKGVATAALGQLADILYRRGFIRLWARVYEWNPASMRVLEKCEFVKEGILRKAVVKDGKLGDAHAYGRVRG